MGWVLVPPLAVGTSKSFLTMGLCFSTCEMRTRVQDPAWGFVSIVTGTQVISSQILGNYCSWLDKMFLQ